MKFEVTAKFRREFDALPIDHKRRFRSLMPAFNAAYEAYWANPATVWSANLRVKRMVSAKGLWEMTWSFTGPDGRAVFEFIETDDDFGVRWRRIGRHEIYNEP